MSEQRKLNPHFFAREENGTARVRIRFTPEEASLIEEAAGRTPVLKWIHDTINHTATAQAQQARKNRPKAPPPE